mmetsp:Transcript_103894/g.263867  ORF Transcript_103894/g.263867 Transcript_103894/m.263867 type:complete len:268 (-) Transcript_103894:106-909(-)
MQHVHIDIGDTEHLELLLESLSRSPELLGIAQLRHDADVLARDARSFDGRPDLVLVPVTLRGVDVSISRLQCPQHRLVRRAVGGQLPHAESEHGQLHTICQGRSCSSVAICRNLQRPARGRGKPHTDVGARQSQGRAGPVCLQPWGQDTHQLPCHRRSGVPVAIPHPGVVAHLVHEVVDRFDLLQQVSRDRGPVLGVRALDCEPQVGPPVAPSVRHALPAAALAALSVTVSGHQGSSPKCSLGKGRLRCNTRASTAETSGTGFARRH